MKKLFIAAMALATIVSCSKDDQGPALDSANKSVSITIINGSNETRAAASIQNPGGNVSAEANANNLDILFAAGDNIVCRKKLVGTKETHGSGESPEFTYGETPTSGDKITYVFHNIPAQVTSIAVVRTNPTIDTAYSVAESNKDNMTLTAYRTLAESEADNVNRTLDQIVLYGEDLDLEDLKTTHEYDGVAYHMWRAEVTVEPLVARLEITEIGCDDLGTLNTNDNPKDYGYDELDLNTLVWGNHNIAPTVGETNKIIGTMYSMGDKVSTLTGGDPNREPTIANRNNTLTADEGKVWSWNINPTTQLNNSNKMVLNITPYAYGYTIAESAKEINLEITGLQDKDKKAVTFEKGKIYKLPIIFGEADIIDDDAALCVEVEVKIANWVVVPVTPVFGN